LLVRRDFDQLTTPVELDRRAVCAGQDPLPDKVTRDRVERPGDLDMSIRSHFRPRVGRNHESVGRHWQQHGEFSLDRPGPLAVTGNRTQLVPISAHHIRQGVRVTRVALGAGHHMTLAITRRLQRIDRIYLVARSDQRLHPRTPIGLDPDHNLISFGILAQMLGDQFVQPGDPGDPFLQPPLGQSLALLVLQFHIVVVLSPIITDEQQNQFSRRQTPCSPACGRTSAT
jgi:hypothetical protein